MRIDIELGPPGSGKTYSNYKAALQDKRPWCFYTPPDPDGKDELSKLPFVYDTEEYLCRGLQRYFQQSRVFVVRYEGNSDVFFEHMDLRNCVLVLDDYPTVCGDEDDVKHIKKLLPMLRRAGIDLVVTAHLIIGDIPKKIRRLSNSIRWWGPCTDPDELQELWARRYGEASTMSREDFEAKLSKNEMREYFRIK